MTARDLSIIFRRRWLLLLIAVVLGLLGGYLTTIGQDDEVQTYRGTHTLTVNNDLVAPVAGDAEGDNGPALTPSRYAVLIDRGPVTVAAAQRLGYTGDPAVLASEIDVEPDDALGTIEISHVSANPARAARVANAFAVEFTEYLTETTAEARQEELDALQTEIDRIQGQLDAIDAQLNVPIPPPNATALEAQRTGLSNQYTGAFERRQFLATQAPGSPVQTLERAEALPVESGLSLPDSPVARLILTGLIGLIAGCAVALALEGIDTRIRDREQAEQAFRLPVIAEIPAMPRGYHGELVTATDRSVPLVEAYRGLSTVLALYDAHETAAGADAASPAAEDGVEAEATSVAPAERSAQVVVIVSPGPGEGKTASAAHIAVAFSEVGRDVLVLDCDFHRPKIHEVFDIRQEAGLRDALAWHQGKRLDLVTHAASGVRVAPSGRAVGDPARLLANAPTMLESARRDADIVIIDTPPMMAVSDAIGLAALADAVLVVCRIGRTTRTAAERTRAILDRVGAPALGVVLTAVPQRGGSYYGYYNKTKTSRHREPSRREKRRRRKKRDALNWDDFNSVAPATNGADRADTQPGSDVVDVGTSSTAPSPRDEA
jgi:capsular exopolysaccharide synthesis family protein